MSLLTELGNLFSAGLYKDAPDGATAGQGGLWMTGCGMGRAFSPHPVLRSNFWGVPRLGCGAPVGAAGGRNIIFGWTAIVQAVGVMFGA